MTTWFAGALALAVLFAGAALGRERPTVWDLELGMSISELPSSHQFKNLACGSGGGVPLAALQDWDDFRRCEPEATGIYEVYFEYDDEAEYRALALETYLDTDEIGTQVNYYPVVTSALFDFSGMLRGIRMVTDPREQPARPGLVPLREREEHYLLGNYLMERWSLDLSTCTD